MPDISVLPRPASAVALPGRDRLAFVDNVRWVMILLVLSMHAVVTYSPFGSWYYTEHLPLDHDCSGY